MQERPPILVPIRVLEGESIPEGVPELLANAHVVLLGYHVVQDQTATDQARQQFEDQATRRLDDFTALLQHAGATVESKLVFTHDGHQTIDRVSSDEDCLAVLIPNATRPLENVLVAIRGVVGVDRFVRLLSGLFGPAEAEGRGTRVRSVLPRRRPETIGVDITLFHIADEDESDEDVETLLDAVATRLAEEGLDPESIDIQTAREGDPKETIVDTADEYDAIVMGESDPSVTTFFFGMRAEQVAEQFLGPVLVVQHRDVEDSEAPSAE